MPAPKNRVNTNKYAVPREHDEQVRVINFWHSIYKNYNVDERVLFSVPNGGFRGIREAQRLKAEGQRNGIPDLFLSLPRGEYHGLYIEMKRVKGGYVRDEQKTFMDAVGALQYKAVVCKGADAAIAALLEYLGG